MKTKLSTFLFFGCVALLGGCNTAAINAQADTQLADARASTESAIDYSRCTDGARFGPNCGLILKLAASEDFRTRFREKVCTGKSTEACEVAFHRLIDAELAKRYFAADWRAVAFECDRQPGLCDDGIAYERLLISSHNARVQEKYSDDEGRIEDERAAAHRADEAEAASNVGAVIDTATVLTGGNVCHSYPSVFGGENTLCSR